MLDIGLQLVEAHLIRHLVAFADLDAVPTQSASLLVYNLRSNHHCAAAHAKQLHEDDDIRVAEYYSVPKQKLIFVEDKLTSRKPASSTPDGIRRLRCCQGRSVSVQFADVELS